MEMMELKCFLILGLLLMTLSTFAPFWEGKQGKMFS